MCMQDIPRSLEIIVLLSRDLTVRETRQAVINGYRVYRVYRLVTRY